MVVDPKNVEPDYSKVAKTVLRLRVFCDGEMSGWGSATAIGPFTAITAKHVQCDDPAQETTYEAVLVGGGVVPMGKGSEAEGEVDVLLLESLGGEFEKWAPIAMDDPQPWEHVYGLTGDGGMDNADWPAFYLKHGTVAKVTYQKVFVSVHCVPGNSGSGWFNDRGELVGVLSAGIWDMRRENWCEGWRPASWLNLISP